MMLLMNRTVTPVGIVLAVVGNAMAVIAFRGLLGNDGGSDISRYVLMMIVGSSFAVGAVFAGGGWLAFHAIFLAVGLGSIWSGIESNDPFDRSFGLLFGGAFAGVAIIAAAMQLAAGSFASVAQWSARRMMTRRAGGAFSLGVASGSGVLGADTRAAALSQLEQLRAQGAITDDQLAAAQASLSGQLPTSPTPPGEIVTQLTALHAQGLLTDQQFDAARAYFDGSAPA